MADTSTVARPYAKAIFELARDSKALAEWDGVLNFLAMLSQDNRVLNFIHNPESTAVQHVDLFMSVLNDIKLSGNQELVSNFLSTLAENNRLPTLEEVYLQFVALRTEFEKTIEVSVISYAPLTKIQEQKLIERLTAKLQRNVALNVTVDKSLQGGAIIRAGHLVFDASVGTQIKKLGSEIAA